MRVALRAGRRGAHVGRAALAVDVGRHPFRGRPPVPRRRAHPRAAHPRPRRDRRPRWRRRRPTPARSSSARDRRAGCPRMRSGRARTGELLLPPPVAAHDPGRVAPLVPERRSRPPARCSRTSWASTSHPGPPDPEHRMAMHRLHPVLRDRRAARAAPARRHWPWRCTGRSASVEEALAPEAITPARHRHRQRRRQVLPGRRDPERPSRTTRAGCCAPCAGSPTRTLPLPLQLGVNRGHVFAAEVGDPRARRVHRDGRHDEHRGPDHVQGAGGRHLRPPRGPRALADPVRRRHRPGRSR